MHPFTSSLSDHLSTKANAANAQLMKSYMKNKFMFLGVPSSVRKEVLKQLIKNHYISNVLELHTIVEELWAMEARELQYCAIDILFMLKRLWILKTIDLIEHCIKTESWWDTV